MSSAGRASDRSPSLRSSRRCEILGISVDPITQRELTEEVGHHVRSGARSYFAYVNIHAINISRKEPHFRDLLNAAHISYCDGEGVRIGARLLGSTIPERIALTYWIWDICALSAREGFSLFLLGGEPGTAEEAAKKMQNRFPSLRIAGTHHGYFEKEGDESDSVLACIRQSGADIILVCFGMPLQEYWTMRNFEQLPAGGLILFGGSTIDYVAGRKKIPPAWMSRNGLEWLFRLVEEPGRLWRRYLIGNPQFLLAILAHRLRKGVRGT